MLGLLVQVLFSIGSINALIPILLIVLLIVAAAGLNRGFSLFNVFGIATLAGINPGGKSSIAGKTAFGVILPTFANKDLGTSKLAPKAAKQIKDRVNKKIDSKLGAQAPTKESIVKDPKKGAVRTAVEARSGMAVYTTPLSRPQQIVARLKEAPRDQLKRAWKGSGIPGLSGTAKMLFLFALPAGYLVYRGVKAGKNLRSRTPAARAEADRQQALATAEAALIGARHEEAHNRKYPTGPIPPMSAAELRAMEKEINERLLGTRFVFGRRGGVL